MIYLGQLVASPIGFICLLGASPLTDLHTLRFLGTQAWNPPTPRTGPTPATSHPTSEPTAPTLRSPAQTQYPSFPGISSNSEFPRQTMYLCLFPPSQFPPSLCVSVNGTPIHPGCSLAITLVLFLLTPHPHPTLPMGPGGFTFKAHPESDTWCHLHSEQPSKCHRLPAQRPASSHSALCGCQEGCPECA